LPDLGLILKIIVSILLILIALGTGFFGYICIRAQVRKWAAGLFSITALCILGVYWLLFMT